MLTALFNAAAFFVLSGMFKINSEFELSKSMTVPLRFFVDMYGTLEVLCMFIGCKMSVVRSSSA